MMDIFYRVVEFSRGHVTVACSHEGVERIFLETTQEQQLSTVFHEYFPGAAMFDGQQTVSAPACCFQVIAELQQYFEGTRRDFTTPLVLRGTPFQQRVWQIVRTIPYGSTITYGEIAERLGEKKLSRAVGFANGANPIPIIVPCHRVIGKHGDLIGYGGGLAMKRYLLQLEGAILL